MKATYKKWFLLRIAAAALLAVLLVVGGWSRLGMPVPVAEIATGRLPCVSYAPFRDGQSPFVEAFVVPPWQIEEDLRLLKTYTDCVRTYSVDQGLREVPRVARELGMTVLLGAWIGRDHERNAAEIARLVETARAFPDVVGAVIVGNEVLLRRELPPADLARLIGAVKRQVPMPVTYADVWEFWLDHPVVAAAADFVTIHILPYWEDDPVGIDGASAHVASVWRKMAAAFPGKRILIGEAGWPSEGRMREGARPSLVNQARFVRETVALARRENIDVNVIEAFDQPWKRWSEGTVGGHWGVFTSGRQPKYPLTGPVVENRDWPSYAIASIVLALFAFLLAWRTGKRMSVASLAMLAVGIALGASALVWQARHAVVASVSALEWAVETGLLGLGAITGACGLAALLRERADGTPPPILPAHAVMERLRPAKAGELFGLAGGLGLLRLIVAIAAAATVLCFIFDPRYRDFPTPAYVAPALAFAALAWRQGRVLGAVPGEERLLAVVIAVGAVIVAFKEGIENGQALAFVAVMIVIAAGLRPDLYRGRGLLGRRLGRRLGRLGLRRRA